MNSTILVIEDERLVAEYIASVLQEAAIGTIVPASNRGEAISIFKNNEVSLIISDVNLFGEHNGLLIVKELLAVKPVPVIYLTAYSLYLLFTSLPILGSKTWTMRGPLSLPPTC